MAETPTIHSRTAPGKVYNPGMKITSSHFEAFLKCPTKCWLRFTSEPTAGNPYAEWVQTENENYRSIAAERLLANAPADEWAAPSGGSRREEAHYSAETLKVAKWRYAVDMPARTQLGSSRGNEAQTSPPENSQSLLTSAATRRVTKVKASALTGEVRKRLAKIIALLASPAPPDLVLNRHCAECEFQARCRKLAVEKDDLSLLANMSAKERQKLRSKGIFTVTQLSYTFRPRRRPKRQRDKREKYHHALKALAIREQKIHIVGSPELKLEGTPVYLDVEGLPDRDFYYLIGVRIGHGDSAVQHSLWADTVADEGKIWREFLALLETIEQPVLIHYGSYETTFLKEMNGRHGKPPDESVAAKAIGSANNLISVIFAKIYFPTFSNSLKEIARHLSFEWSDAGASGTGSIAWRQDWEKSRSTVSKQRLITYNTEPERFSLKR